MVMALVTWGDHKELCNDRITIFCDNEAVVHMVNKLMSSCHWCMKLLRILALEGLNKNRKIQVLHVVSKENYLADAISRMDWTRFWTKAPRATNEKPDALDSRLCPVTKFYEDSINYLSNF